MTETNYKIDPYSQTWQFVKAWADAEIARARERNDSLKIDHDKTTELRCTIKTLKKLLSLADPEAAIKRRMEPIEDD